jgi:hypothetical protein
MTPFLITVGILGLIGLGVLILAGIAAVHFLDKLNDTMKRVEKHVSPEVFMMGDDDDEEDDDEDDVVPGQSSIKGLSDKAIENIMKNIRGESPEMKSFLKKLDDEKETPEE